MSFSFSFSGEDIDIEDDPSPPNDSEHLATKLGAATLTSPQRLILPKRHTLKALLESVPSIVSYQLLPVPVTGSARAHDGQGDPATERVVTVPKRSLFDIRQQLMVEADPTTTPSNRVLSGQPAVSAPESLLEGLTTGDLRTGVYEGGFKTWECAVDLAGYVAAHYADGGEAREQHGGIRGTEQWHVVELGAGSAVPSLVLLLSLLQQRRGQRDGDRGAWGKVRLTLCDYNEDVLRLCTAVNVFLAVVLCVNGGEVWNATGTGQEDEGDLEVSEQMVQQALDTLQDLSIEIDFISGAWGTEFLSLLNSNCDGEKPNVLVLASETIYSPESLPLFTQTGLTLLRDAGERSAALVAAKKVYFGVGGGVAEFEEELARQGGFAETVFDVKRAGVGRVILDIKARTIVGR